MSKIELLARIQGEDERKAHVVFETSGVAAEPRLLLLESFDDERGTEMERRGSHRLARHGFARGCR